MSHQEKSRNGKGRLRVPGEIPEPPTLAWFRSPETASLAASSISSLGSLATAIEGKSRQPTAGTTVPLIADGAQNPESVSCTKATKQTQNFQNLFPLAPEATITTPATASRVSQSFTTSSASVKSSIPSAGATTNAHWDARRNQLEKSLNEARNYNQNLREQQLLDDSHKSASYEETRRDQRREWECWNVSTTRTVMQKHEQHQQHKQQQEVLRSSEFNDMIERQIALDKSGYVAPKSTTYAEEQQMWAQERRKKLEHNSAGVNKINCQTEKDLSTSLVQSKAPRKQTLLHRLVRPLGSPQVIAKQEHVLSTVQNIPEVTAGEVDPANLFFLDGEILNLGCYEKGQHLTSKAIDSYLTIMGVKHESKLAEKKMEVWNSKSVFCTKKVNVQLFNNNTKHEQISQLVMISDDFLTAVRTSDSLTGILKNSDTCSAYVVEKSARKIRVLDKTSKLNDTCYVKLKSEIENRLSESGWAVEYLQERLLPYSSESDASVHALYAIEALVLGTGTLPGVKSLSDYRSKLKWTTINEADSCIKAIEETKSQVLQKMNECHKKLLTKVEASRNAAELQESFSCFQTVDSKMYCQPCVNTKCFRPISVPEEQGAKQFQSLKGNVIKHLKSDTHKKNLGIRIEVSESHPESSYRQAKSVEDLKKLYPWVEQKESASIECIACDATFGVPEESETFTSKFSMLKSRIRSHGNLPSHQARLLKQTSEADRIVGKNLGLNAYLCLKDTLGLSQYERQINADFAKNLNVGELCHSREFVAEMRSHFADVLKKKYIQQCSRILESTGQKPNISIVADKTTIQGKSYHLIGSVSHSNGVFHSYLLGVVESAGDDGEKMAADIFRVLEEYFPPEEMKKLITGACMDGDYHHKKVPEILMNLMGVPEEHRHAYSFQWDNAHVLELVCKNARGQKKQLSSITQTWIRTTLTTMSSIGSDFRYGSSLKELKKLAENLREDDETVPGLRRFQTYSDTRFSSHLSKFIDALDQNYVFLHPYFKQCDPNTFATIAAPEFVLRMSGLGDIYSLVGEASKKLQVVNKMPWHSAEAIRDLRNQLQRIHEACSDEIFRPVPEVLPRFSSCCSGVKAYNSYKGCDLNTVPPKRTRSSEDATGRDIGYIISKESNAVAEHAEALIEKLDARFHGKPGKGRKQVAELYGADTLSLISDCFSFNKIRTECNVGKFDTLVNIYNSAGLLDSTVSSEEVRNQYEKLCNAVRTEYPEKVDVKTETDFYLRKLDGPKSTFPEVMKVLSVSANRNCVESVVETMTSQIGDILEGRANLRTDNLSDELLIRHNGPPAGPKSEKLVEEALNLKFSSKPWKFHRTSGDKNKLKSYDTGSKVITRLQDGDEKIQF